MTVAESMNCQYLVENFGTSLLSFRSCSVHAHCKQAAVDMRDRITVGMCVSFSYVAVVGTWEVIRPLSLTCLQSFQRKYV